MSQSLSKYSADSVRRQIPRSFLCNGGLIFVDRLSDRSLNLAGAQATGANVNGLMSAVNDSLYLSDVGLPGSVGLSVRVRNLETENHGLITEITLCHFKLPPI